MGLPGVQTRTFNTRAIALAGDELHVTEGEMDAMSLSVAGFQAIGIPGVNALSKSFARMVAGFSKVTVWADGDDAGRGMAEKIARLVPIARILIMSAGHDVNSILVEGGPGALQRLNAGEPYTGPELVTAGVADKYAGDPPF
jgi:DNA primase